MIKRGTFAAIAARLRFRRRYIDDPAIISMIRRRYINDPAKIQAFSK
jgi:hypothetical protein